MSAAHHETLPDRARIRRDYVLGLVLALILTCAAFAAVSWQLAAPHALAGLVFLLGLLQVLVHFRYFLHIDFRAPSRDKLQLLVFSSIILVLMAGGTLVILADLRSRMM
ncbi:MAG: cytochrome C oxidase subunit IV family protein [Betaproteobacteria bacterium]|nr:cytochrome C oxidase subunit IV family protein [Betaproteobacteria bacterium]MDE1955884.1 cytochrome C oxidase subunit IV family protein [Betaproteobacteria bacterium]MDE2153784.1 cytochrome C oxidase subunit IV family protein [Betaproteobacteria bacterium]MDE2478846.1 cytochrome C oxidase subunit IV family protein [Betaproteobacteria bacterium]